MAEAHEIDERPSGGAEKETLGAGATNNANSMTATEEKGEAPDEPIDKASSTAKQRRKVKPSFEWIEEWLEEVEFMHFQPTLDTSDLSPEERFGLFAQYPAKSFDFGNEGYTASTNIGQELLQITAPDNECGLVYFRGSFPDHPDAILARAQRRVGGESTFGLKLLSSASNESAVQHLSQGFVNYRWPYVKFNPGNFDEDYVVCSAFSFVAKRTVFQALYIPRSNTETRKFTVRVGGKVRIGCICHADPTPHEKPSLDLGKTSRVEKSKYVVESDGCLLKCFSCKYRKWLVIQLFVNGSAISMPERSLEHVGEEADVSFDHTDITVGPKEGALVVATFSVRDQSDHEEHLTAPSSRDLETYMGTKESTVSATHRFWADSVGNIDDAIDLPASARCLEQILGVTSIPMPATLNLRFSDLVLNKSESSESNFNENEFNDGESNESESTKSEHEIESGNNLIDEEDSESGSSSDLVNDDPKSRGGKPPRSNKEKSNEDVTYPGIALLRGIMFYQYVDLFSSFWQIRFLVKAYDFLSIMDAQGVYSTEEDSPEHHVSKHKPRKPPRTDKVRDLYLTKIKDTLHRSLIWVCFWSYTQDGNPTSPAISRCQAPLRHASRNDEDNMHTSRGVAKDKGGSNTLYVPIAIWFVMKNCKEALPPSFHSMLAKVFGRLHRYWTEMTDEAHDSASDRAAGFSYTRFCLLSWYSCGCLHLILQSLLESLKSPPPTKLPFGEKKKWLILEKELTHKVKALKSKARKAVLVSKDRSNDSYSDEHESVDRLAFLAMELGLITREEDTQATSCAARARQSILERRYTKTLNPGVLSLSQSSLVRASIKPPWELTCVNHHSRLALWTERRIDDDWFLARDGCQRFLTSDFLYTPSWDMSRDNIAEVWWDLDASCVVCSTALDVRVHNASGKAETGVDTISNIQQIQNKVTSPTSHVKTEDIRDNEAIKLIEYGSPKEDMSGGDIVALLRKQLDYQEKMIQVFKKGSEDVIEFDWMSCQPSITFHPDAWALSLDQTYGKFGVTGTKTERLGDENKKFLSKKRNRTVLPISDADQNPKTAFEILELLAEDRGLEFLSIFDISLLSNYEFRCSNRSGRMGVRFPEYVEGESHSQFDFGSHFDNIEADESSIDDPVLDFWLAYLDGYLATEKCRLEKLSYQLRKKYEDIPLGVKTALQDSKTLEGVKKNIRQGVRAVLGKSTSYLVSILSLPNTTCLALIKVNSSSFIQRLSQPIIRYFNNVLQYHALNALNLRQQNNSQFWDARDDVWITYITLSSWKLTAIGDNSSNVENEINEYRRKFPFPPKEVEQPEGLQLKYNVSEASSAVIMSGDRAGNWWACIVVSPTLSETSLNFSVGSTLKILQQFIHQPSSGRCLVFISILSSLCLSLCEDFKKILIELAKVIKDGDTVLDNGLQLESGNDLGILKAVLWELEALRVFGDRLSASLDKIKDAKQNMQNYLSQGPGRRQKELDRQLQIQLAEFEDCYGRLASVHTKIEQKIAQISRYRDGISSISNLADTHTSIKQNETIRILTYITIAYLPLSFVAALFSVSIISAGWTAGMFGGLLVAFVLLTLILAGNLERLINVWWIIWSPVFNIFGPAEAGQQDERAPENEKNSEQEPLKNTNGSGSGQPHSIWPQLHQRRGKNNRDK